MDKNKDLKINLLDNKKCPDKFLEVFKKALSFFPELENTSIFVHEMPFYGVQHTTRAYPPLVILHWPKSKWTFPIVINKNKNINIPFSNLTREQQVGILAHELSHITMYINFSRRDILYFSIKYALNKEFVRKIERETDLRVIEKGAGIYLLKERIYASIYRENNPYPEVQDTYITQIELIENFKKYPNLYSQEDINDFISQLENIKKEGKISCLPPPCINFKKNKAQHKNNYRFYSWVFRNVLYFNDKENAFKISPL